MTENEVKIFEIIKRYIDNYNEGPTLREIQNKLGYLSISNIYSNVLKLDKKGYIIYKKGRKKGIYLPSTKKNIYLKTINTKKMSFSFCNKIIYKVKGDYFSNINIHNSDYIIIDKNKKILTKGLGLFLIENKPRLMKYEVIDTYYILTDYETLYLDRIDFLGRACGLLRTYS